MTNTMRNTGLALAGVTAVVSGFSVFVNGYGVAHFDDATTYTTAKNLVTAVVLMVAVVVMRGRRAPDAATPPTASAATRTRRDTATLATIAVIGGSVPFVLFFEGLAQVSSTNAAFIHKTLVAWVAILAVAFLGERVTVWHVTAIALILLGYAQLAGGVGFPDVGTGEALLLAATLCWSVEVILSRSLLRRGVAPMVVSTWRMAGGIVLLLAWAIVRGALGDLLGLSATQWAWAVLTGLFLTAYVVSWHHALARAPAVDVTAVLSIGAVITAALNAGVRGAVIEPVGLILLLTGGLLVAWASIVGRRTPQQAAAL
ncbi:MAG TPA: DMT family transporter [Ilumatobacteraceae bacterium]|nr:DMT family transporter [Ilumatobacteraceae bacterium]